MIVAPFSNIPLVRRSVRFSLSRQVFADGSATTTFGRVTSKSSVKLGVVGGEGCVFGALTAWRMSPYKYDANNVM